MTPIFNVKIVHGAQLRISDLSQQNEEYVDENLNDLVLLKLYYTKNKFKYSETSTLNIIQYAPKEDSDYSNIIDTQFVEHTSALDESYFDLLKDGHYRIYHFILPNEEWVKTQLSLSDNALNDIDNIYFIKDQQIYKLIKECSTTREPDGEDGFLITKKEEWVCKKVDIETLLFINTAYTTISRSKKNIFSIFYLWDCFINLCKPILNSSNLRCLSNNQDLKELIFKRDFIWMTINVLKYYSEFDQLYEALRILNNINYCAGFCKDVPTTLKSNSSSCGCSK